MTKEVLTVLVSTFRNRIFDIEKVLLEEHEYIKYIIVHQVEEGIEYTPFLSQVFQNRNDITYVSTSTIGISKSRNVALSHIAGGIGVIMDDDVKLHCDFYDIVITAFNEQKSADLITFQIGDIESDLLLKAYPAKSITHSLRSILRVGSIEVAFRAEAVKKSGVLFPEYLGAGTSLPACEEPVFLSALLRKGLKLSSCPKIIAYHPMISSGKVFTSPETLICRGVAFRKVFGGFFGIAAIIVFYLKNRSKFASVKGIALKHLSKGFFLNPTNQQ